MKKDCNYNIFGNNCNRNNLQESCSNNTFGDTCAKIEFNIKCGDNILGDNCLGVTFKEECIRNTVASYCSDINFGSGCNNNRINKIVGDIRLGEHNEYWEINKVKSFKNDNMYYRYCKVEDTDSIIVVTQSVTTSDSNYVQYIVIDQYENPIVTEVRQTYRTYFKLGSDRIIYPDLNN